MLSFNLFQQNDPQWFKNSLIQFFEFQKDRPRRNDIAFSTISNYHEDIKLVICDIHSVIGPIEWDRI
jgi:hypothetical protein